MNQHRPLVDVIIPMRNSHGTIGRALHSLLDQTETRWRAIVIDDGSEDKSATTVHAISDPRISIHYQEHAGVSSARNHGFRVSDSTHVCFLDADDTIDPSYFERMIRLAAGGACGVICGCRYVNTSGSPILPAFVPSRRVLTREAFLSMDCPPIMSILHRRVSLERIVRDGLLFDDKLEAFEDWDMLMRVVCAHKGSDDLWSIVPDLLASYWCTPMSLSSNIRCVYACGLDMIRKHGSSDHAHSWKLRSWAACIASSEISMASEIYTDLGSLRDEDFVAVLGSLRWQVCRRNAINETQLAHHADHVQQALASSLLPGALLDRLLAEVEQWGINRWALALMNARRLVPGAGRLVVYGLGKNGQRVLVQAECSGTKVCVIDDNPDCNIGLHDQIEHQSLTPTDIVLVTPDDSGAILHRLAAITPARALTIQEALELESLRTSDAHRSNQPSV
ncbi:MAG: glycosyltransferase family 2 protein [Phycisphaerales bacterium]|nr:glycosyltransferase family 2 protein [Phycisphaerales bacterium]